MYPATDLGAHVIAFWTVNTSLFPRVSPDADCSNVGADRNSDKPGRAIQLGAAVWRRLSVLALGLLIRGRRAF
jgi:hypothetical protein